MQALLKILSRIYEKTAYLFLLFSLGVGRIFIAFIKIIAPLIPGKPTKDFLFFPYTHKDNTGTMSRFQEYFPFLEKDGLKYDIHYICNTQYYEWIFYTSRKTRVIEYMFYNKIFWNRLRWILKAKNYRAVFFQRALFPDFYEQKLAILERLLHRLNSNVTVDYFDADYIRKETYIINIVKNCDKVSVVNEHLYKYFSHHHHRIFYNNLSIDVTRYKQKNNFSIHSPVRIYWTGSVGNASNLQLILPILENINRQIPITLVMICRTNAGLDYSFIEQHPWEDKGYIDYMAGSDIAIYPVLIDDEYSKGKVAYKALEYATVKVPMVASPQGLPSNFEHEKDVFVAHTKQEWEKYLLRLINDSTLRKTLAENAYQKILTYHDVRVTYKKFIEILKA